MEGNIIFDLDKVYKKYPNEYFLLFIHVYLFDKVIKKINYKLWHFLKDKLAFIKRAKLFIDKDFYITIPPYTDIFRYVAYILHIPA